MKKLIIVASILFVLGIMNAESKTWLLPDWQGAGIETRRFDGEGNRDEPLCAEAVDSDGYRLYHKATRCSAPKIFDEYCPYSDEWISECYCPEVFANNCVGSYKGDTRVTDPKSGYSSCDGLWVACCNYTCPSGTTSDDPGGCGGYTYNGCGERCYYPYQECCTPSSDETGCSCGTYSCSDGCGGTRTCCSSCPVVEDDSDANTSSSSSGGDDSSSSSGGEEETCTPSADETGCSYGTKSCDDGCGGTRNCCKTCADNGGSSTCSGKANASDCTYGSSGTCTDCSGNVLNVCNSAPSCTPLADETGCNYGTESCDDGCEGTRTCCKACSYSTIASDCSNQCKNVGGTTYYDSCGSSLCSSDQVCYNGSCCTPDDFEWPEPACGCDGWAEEDVGCGLTVSYCRKPKECGDNFVSNCEGTIMECGGLSCCCPTGQCYDDYGSNMCDCPTGSAK